MKPLGKITYRPQWRGRLSNLNWNILLLALSIFLAAFLSNFRGMRKIFSIFFCWGRLLSPSSEIVFKASSRRLDQDEYISLGHMSSRRLLAKSVFKTYSRHLEDVLKMSWRRLQGVLKTSSKRLQKVLHRYFQIWKLTPSLWSVSYFA